MTHVFGRPQTAFVYTHCVYLCLCCCMHHEHLVKFHNISAPKEIFTSICFGEWHCETLQMCSPLKSLILITVNMAYVTRVTLSHNKIKVIPPGIANLNNLEILNLSNNQIEELPVSLSSMPKLRILNVSINRLNQLPRGFGAFPLLEVLDLSYNNLNENLLPGNFFMMGTSIDSSHTGELYSLIFTLQKRYELCIWVITILSICPLRWEI